MSCVIYDVNIADLEMICQMIYTTSMFNYVTCLIVNYLFVMSTLTDDDITTTDE